MALCVQADESGYLIQSQVCDYVLLSQDEYSAFTVENIISMLQLYFEFDVALAGQLSGAFCLTFFAGHSVGRMVRIMGKHG